MMRRQFKREMIGLTMREVASDRITVEQGCRWRKGCVESERWSNHDKAIESLKFKHGHELQITFIKHLQNVDETDTEELNEKNTLKGHNGRTRQAVRTVSWAGCTGQSDT